MTWAFRRADYLTLQDERQAVVLAKSPSTEPVPVPLAIAPGPSVAAAHTKVDVGALPAVPAVQQSKRPEKPSFSTSRDLWALANQAAASKDGALILEGLWAARECVGLLAMQDDSRVRIQSFQGLERAKADLALTEVLSRCRGFGRANHAERQALLRQLEQLNQSDLAIKLKPPGNWTPDEILKVIGTGSAVASFHALIGLSAWVSGRHQGAMSADEHERLDTLFLAAAFSAGCDLGRDCSVNAYESQLQCAIGAGCDGWILAHRDPSMLQADWDYVVAKRAEIVAAVRGGRLDALGYR